MIVVRGGNGERRERRHKKVCGKTHVLCIHCFYNIAKGYNYYELGWFFNSAVHLEVGHELPHFRERVREGTVAQSHHHQFNPLQQFRKHAVILCLHVLYLHHQTNDLMKDMQAM